MMNTENMDNKRVKIYIPEEIQELLNNGEISEKDIMNFLNGGSILPKALVDMLEKPGVQIKMEWLEDQV